MCERHKVADNSIEHNEFIHSVMKKADLERQHLENVSVDHPSHYTFGTIEVIQVIEDWKLDFHEGNVVKYVARSKHKGNRLEDLKKAQWYLNRLIDNLQKEDACLGSK
jgi:hypothetical protein